MKLWNRNVLSVCALAVSFGTGAFWTSPVLPKLKGETSLNGSLFFQPITIEESSKIASFFSFGCIFGPIIATLLNDSLGRKKTLSLCSFILTLAYLTTAFAPNVETLYATRILNGLACGCLYVVLPIFASEIAENENRATVNAFTGVMFNVGSILCLGIGPYVTVKTLTLLCALPNLFSLISFLFWVPESPYFLLIKSKEVKAKKSLIKLRKSNEVDMEMLEIKSYVFNDVNKHNVLRSFFTKKVLKCFYISFGLHTGQELTGCIVISSYMQSIFIAAGSTLPSDVCSVIVGCVQLTSISISTKLVGIVGMKPLFLLSSGGCSISLLIFGIYFYLLDNAHDISNFYWLPLACLIFYMISLKLGLAVLPRAVMAEIFPSDVKSFASTVTIVYQQIIGFLMTMYFPIVSQYISMAYCFWFFSISCALCFVFVIFELPETKGKSFEEIQIMLHGPTLPKVQQIS